MDYVYELHQNGAVVATGRMVAESRLERGDRVPFGTDTAIVKDVRPSFGGTTRLILEKRASLMRLAGIASSVSQNVDDWHLIEADALATLRTILQAGRVRLARWKVGTARQLRASARPDQAASGGVER